MTTFILHGPITDMRLMVDAAIEMAAHPEWTLVGMRYGGMVFSVKRNTKSITVRRQFEGEGAQSDQSTETQNTRKSRYGKGTSNGDQG